MIKKEVLLEKIANVVGENETDEYIELLEYIDDELDESNDDTINELKNEVKKWKNRYKERFEKKEKPKIENDDDYEVEKTKYEELFEEGK